VSGREGVLVRPKSWFFWFEHMPVPIRRTFYAAGSAGWVYNLVVAVSDHSGQLWTAVSIIGLIFGLRGLAQSALPARIDGES